MRFMMLVEHILETAQRRLAVLRREAPVCDAARILMNSDTPLIVVCDGEGIAIGVISRTDVIKMLTSARLDVASTSAEAIMTTGVLSCHIEQPLQRVWEDMNTRSLRSIPILDEASRPLGIVQARDLASALLEDITYEENLLRDYVLGVGYQ